MCTHIRMFACTCVSMYLYACTYIIYMCKYVYIYVYICIIYMRFTRMCIRIIYMAVWACKHLSPMSHMYVNSQILYVCGYTYYIHVRTYGCILCIYVYILR